MIYTPCKIITEQNKQDIRDYYLAYPMNMQEVANQFHLSLPTIGKILRDIPKYPKAKVFNPDMDEDFFAVIDQEDKAYFLGLIISDGNVFHSDDGKRQDSISITLDSNDEYILQAFKEALHLNTSVAHDGRGCSQIAVRSNKLSQELVQYGVVPRKSFTTYLPDIDSKYMPHTIRGIFDGDGSIQCGLLSTNRYLHSFSFCGTHQLMQDISNYLTIELSLHQRPTIYDYKNKQLAEMKIQNKEDMKTFGDWIYNDAHLFLVRKWNTYQKFKQYYQYGNTEITSQIAQG